ncbi:DUF6037 family protein [Mesobacillus sp. AQ2]|uniref:DUF6037 family protein n=1 Tax=Mesobacillus sp. AQ2 TaxID=3043332 RepID=UPI0024C1AAD6|nr:DUF6037 family protein [Mesobacillus sp. AQ2]WHX41193.1 DUF6037 family protein [Mesobacillus sp. AQ2]
MKLNGLKGLFKSMKHQAIERYKFDFIYQNVKFDVLYFIDEVPNILAFGIKQHNYYFEIPVRKEFEITAFLDEYNKFCKIMGFTYNPDSPYKPAYFFEEFNKHIPNIAIQTNIPKPSQVAVYRDKVEEADKIYFIKWRDNTKTGKNVSLKNLEKTRLLLSYDAYLMCKAKNISSCWSSLPSEENQFSLPY